MDISLSKNTEAKVFMKKLENKNNINKFHQTNIAKTIEKFSRCKINRYKENKI